MSETSHFIAAGNQQLHYTKSGSGRQLLLTFHGYGDDATFFNPLQQYLGEEYTTLSFDLPHHGKSKWADDTLFTKQDLITLVETLKGDYNVSKVSLLGYSLGGRVCLTIVAYMPASISRVVLLASDGLEKNIYYNFFTQNSIGKKIFRNMLERPKPYFRVMDWLLKAKLVHPSRHKFAMHFLQSEERRKFLLQVWGSTSGLVPGPFRLKEAIRRYAIPVYIFMGAYDKILPPALAEKFKNGLKTVQVTILEKGHRIFDHETAQQIAERLL